MSKDAIPDELIKRVEKAMQDAWPTSGYESVLEAKIKAAIRTVREFDHAQ